MGKLAQRLSHLSKLTRSFGPGIFRVYAGKVLNTRRMRLSLRQVGPVSLRPRNSDLETLYQVYGEKQYDLLSFKQGWRLQAQYDEMIRNDIVPIVIDAGANVGAFTLWFRQKFPGAHIVAVEPEPENLAICRDNIGAFSNVTLVAGGVASAPGKATVVKDGPGWEARTVRTEDAIGISFFTIANLVKMAPENGHLWIVKIDIEGFESDLFGQNLDWISDASVIVVELHDWLFPDQKTSQAMQKALFDKGFEVLIRGEHLIFIRDTEHLQQRFPGMRHYPDRSASELR